MQFKFHHLDPISAEFEIGFQFYHEMEITEIPRYIHILTQRSWNYAFSPSITCEFFSITFKHKELVIRDISNLKEFRYSYRRLETSHQNVYITRKNREKKSLIAWLTDIVAKNKSDAGKKSKRLAFNWSNTITIIEMTILLVIFLFISGLNVKWLIQLLILDTAHEFYHSTTIVLLLSVSAIAFGWTLHFFYTIAFTRSFFINMELEIPFLNDFGSDKFEFLVIILAQGLYSYIWPLLINMVDPEATIDLGTFYHNYIQVMQVIIVVYIALFIPMIVIFIRKEMKKREIILDILKEKILDPLEQQKNFYLTLYKMVEEKGVVEFGVTSKMVAYGTLVLSAVPLIFGD